MFSTISHHTQLHARRLNHTHVASTVAASAAAAQLMNIGGVVVKTGSINQSDEKKIVVAKILQILRSTVEFNDELEKSWRSMHFKNPALKFKVDKWDLD